MERTHLAKQSKYCAEHIARILSIKKANQSVRARTRKTYENIIFDFLNKETDAYQTIRRIRGFHAKIHESYRDQEVFRLILEYLWLVPKRSEIEKDLIGLAINCYTSQVTNQQQARLFSHEITNALKSPFTNIRNIAIQLQATVPVTPIELMKLSDPRVFRDVQESIAQRIITNRQAEYLSQLFEYINFLCLQKDQTQTLERLLNDLRGWRDPVEPEYLKELFRCYLKDQFVDRNSRGLILRNLTDHGPELTPALIAVYENEIETRDATLTLLSQMASYGQLPALRYLLQCCEDTGIQKNKDKLLHSLKKLSGRKQGKMVSQAWREVDLWIDRNQSNMHLTSLIQDINEARFNNTLTLDDISQLLNGSNELIWKLRQSRVETFEELSKYLHNPSLEPSIKARALHLMCQVRVNKLKKYQIIKESLDSGSHTIIKKAIIELSNLGLPQSDQTLRNKFFLLYRNGDLTTKELIKTKWHSIFNELMPSSGSKAD